MVMTVVSSSEPTSSAATRQRCPSRSGLIASKPTAYPAPGKVGPARRVGRKASMPQARRSGGLDLERVERVGRDAERSIFKLHAWEPPFVDRLHDHPGRDTQPPRNFGGQKHVVVAHSAPPFVETQPTVQHTNDRCQLVLQPGRSTSIAKLEASIFHGFEDTEGVVERKDDGARHRVVERFGRAHDASVNHVCDGPPG